MTSALAFEIVKYLGAAYLIYLGICALLEQSGDIHLPQVRRVTPSVAFRQAVLTEVLNPKTALFFLSFLPQFANPARGAVWAQLLVLGAIFVAISIAYTALLALGAASVAGLAHPPQQHRQMEGQARRQHLHRPRGAARPPGAAVALGPLRCRISASGAMVC